VARFSDDHEPKRDVVRRVLRQHPALLDQLIDGTTVDHGDGRPRKDGAWALMFLDFCCTRDINVHPWWKETRDGDWTDAGFAGKPAYRTVQRRFAELGEHVAAFEETTGKIVAQANDHVGGWIGFDVSVDATERETNARLHTTAPTTSRAPGALAPRRAVPASRPPAACRPNIPSARPCSPCTTNATTSTSSPSRTRPTPRP
jgi:hypothetical protein